jgi:hypothetical protein
MSRLEEILLDLYGPCVKHLTIRSQNCEMIAWTPIASGMWDLRMYRERTEHDEQVDRIQKMLRGS